MNASHLPSAYLWKHIFTASIRIHYSSASHSSQLKQSPNEAEKAKRWALGNRKYRIFSKTDKNKGNKTLVETTTWNDMNFYCNSVQKTPNNVLSCTLLHQAVFLPWYLLEPYMDISKICTAAHRPQVSPIRMTWDCSQTSLASPVLEYFWIPSVIWIPQCQISGLKPLLLILPSTTSSTITQTPTSNWFSDRFPPSLTKIFSFKSFFENIFKSPSKGETLLMATWRIKHKISLIRNQKLNPKTLIHRNLIFI